GPKALKLIALLCTQPNISISNEQISMHVWEELVNDRTLRSLMFRLRSATDEDLIKNVSGTGYMIQTGQKPNINA
ncbi:MAG: helix-turn-helix domain-containing protein, partial [Campylobacterota bacterium]|nr:helix-turn-helix domain-containing protein [Campylobacterota bacterium]